MKTTIALADDHVLLRNGLSALLKDLDYDVVLEADHGKDLIANWPLAAPPQVVLMDINMPQMDGYDTALWLRQEHPEVKVIALSMYDDEKAIMRMLKNGARGYILKDSDPAELKEAIQAVITKGFYYSEMVTGKLIHKVIQPDDGLVTKTLSGLNEKETEFLKWVCTEMTYKEIADQMCLSPRTIDGYRDALFEKLHIKSRVGLAIYAIRNGIVTL